MSCSCHTTDISSHKQAISNMQAPLLLRQKNREQGVGSFAEPSKPEADLQSLSILKDTIVQALTVSGLCISTIIIIIIIMIIVIIIIIIILIIIIGSQ